MHRPLQPWLKDPVRESLFILAPSLVPILIVFLFRDYFIGSEVSTVWWIVLVLCIDVGHVYSTLFRFYWDPQLFDTHKRTLIIIPVVAFTVGFGLHRIDPLMFWRLLAYTAVFHFIRQQYGFMRIYSRKDNANRFSKIVDNAAIYSATLYPVIYWHFHLTDSLSWFIKGDFVPLSYSGLDTFLLALYVVIAIIYLAKETMFSFRLCRINIPKNLIVVGTYGSWYVGIVAFEGDLIFTLLNVVSHGIPYMALVWLYGEKSVAKRFSFSWKGVVAFLAVLLVLAYLEEGFWNLMVWNDHPEIFPLFTGFVINNEVMLSLIVALLVLPQITHYVIDGFIWKLNKNVSDVVSSHQF